MRCCFRWFLKQVEVISLSSLGSSLNNFAARYPNIRFPVSVRMLGRLKLLSCRVERSRLVTLRWNIAAMEAGCSAQITLFRNTSVSWDDKSVADSHPSASRTSATCSYLRRPEITLAAKFRICDFSSRNYRIQANSSGRARAPGRSQSSQ